MYIPDTFTFYHYTDKDCKTLYTATLTSDNKVYVTWDEYGGGTHFDREAAERNIKKKTWIVHFVPEKNREAIHLLEDRW